VNKSDVADYPRVPQQCAFFNNKFLIYSSLGSFFIPCIIIFAIYYRIFMVIMAQARKTRKQFRPKAIIESAAAQHRSNADNLVTTFYHEKQSTVGQVSIVPDKTSLTLPIDTNDTLPVPNKALEIRRNSLMLTLSTPGLSPIRYQSRNRTHRASSSGEQNDDEERDDDIPVFIQHEQTNGNNNNNNNNKEHDNQIEILPSNVTSHKTKNCSSQTDNEHHCHYPAKRIKTRLKSKIKTDGSAITTAVNALTNNVKIGKRKAYSRMKKERKATQTLIIVLSKSRH
jgi:hypothetical protein